MKTILRYAWSFWLGLGTGWLLDIHIDDWRWWAFCMPLIILVGISMNVPEDKEEEKK